ncbi:ATP-binding cassette domain-containing protein [Nocardioides sp.]|uniref:ATP-binding cassette domain-containing protein n=1 Tax=Nocardioides sp. TaxID=35761 RepID=UPI0019B68058|nr:ATP-binding cassette domain-containing protein [Nocardioides sp.]MBC7275591.1 ATP-binding cassette domain-containing protein [Nocardioides sp.]
MTNHTHQQPVIRAQGLTKHFSRSKKTVEAVRGLDLEIHRGELVAFLGPNGAGKSTTLRMLTTLIPPTAGTAEVAGHDVVRDRAAVRRSIGYVGQGNAAAFIQRGRDELMSQARAHGIPRATAKARVDELLSAFDLAEHADRQVQTLSGGQRRRLDIAIGLLNHPEVLFLDEPSTGLDPQNRANLQDQIRRLHDDGTTIVLTTHYLEEADALAGRVIVIDHGLVIADDTAPRLKARLGDLVLLAFGTEADASAAATRAESGLASAVVERTGTQVSIRSPRGADTAPALAIDLAAHGTPAIRMEVRTPTLDDVFLDLTGRSLRESTESTDTTQTEGAAA